jgi:hypothetical protein
MVWHPGYFSKPSTRKIGDLDDSITSLITIYYGKLKQTLGFFFNVLTILAGRVSCVCWHMFHFSGLALLRRCFFVAHA